METRYRFSAWPAGTKAYLSYWPARLHRLAKSIPRKRFLGSINVYKYGLCISTLPWAANTGRTTTSTWLSLLSIFLLCAHFVHCKVQPIQIILIELFWGCLEVLKNMDPIFNVSLICAICKIIYHTCCISPSFDPTPPPNSFLSSSSNKRPYH